MAFRVSTLRRLVRLNRSASASIRMRLTTTVRLTRAPRLKKSLPLPAFREMKAPSTIGRPAVPCTVVTPDVTLSGSAFAYDGLGRHPLLPPAATHDHETDPGSKA